MAARSTAVSRGGGTTPASGWYRPAAGEQLIYSRASDVSAHLFIFLWSKPIENPSVSTPTRKRDKSFEGGDEETGIYHFHLLLLLFLLLLLLLLGFGCDGENGGGYLPRGHRAEMF